VSSREVVFLSAIPLLPPSLPPSLGGGHASLAMWGLRERGRSVAHTGHTHIHTHTLICVREGSVAQDTETGPTHTHTHTHIDVCV